MRVKSVSLVRRLELQFRGNVLPNAIALGDVDNDQNNELVVGTLTGHLYLYKVVLGSPSHNVSPTGLPGPSVPPWRTCSGLGTITSVVVGDVRNIGRNSIICINAEGGCFMFDFPFIMMNNTNEIPSALNTQNISITPSLTPTFPSIPNTQGPMSLASLDESSIHQSANIPVGNTNFTGLSTLIARANWSTSLPTNTSVALIGDVDGDGLNELVLGRTDRQIHTYQLSTSLALPSTPPARNTGRSGVKVQVGRAKSTVDYNKMFWHNKALWRVSHPIASLSLALVPTPLLIVGQSGGEYLMIDSIGNVRSSKDTESLSENSGLTAPAFVMKSPSGLRDVVVSLLPDHSLALSRINEFTETIGYIPTGLSHRVIGFGEVPSALNSTITSPTGVIGWADGTTLLFNSLAQACTRFQFPHAPVAAFISGMFSLGPGGNVPFLFYVGFGGAIYGYSDPAALACEPTSRLGAYLEPVINKYDKVLDFLKNKVICSNTDNQKTNDQGSNTKTGNNSPTKASSRTPKNNKKKKGKKPEPIIAPKVPKELVPDLSPKMSALEQQALIFRYILYMALPASKQNNTFSLPSPFQKTNTINEKKVRSSAKKSDKPTSTFLPVPQHPTNYRNSNSTSNPTPDYSPSTVSFPVTPSRSSTSLQTVLSVLPASLTRRPSALHITFRSPRPSPQTTSSPTSDPAIPIITPTSAASSPALGSTTSCVEDLEKLKSGAI